MKKTTMNMQLESFGKKGTIKKIETGDKHYIVYQYGAVRNEETITYVPKNQENYELLVENYYKDLKEYLDYNKDKYETYQKTRLKKKINPNVINLLNIAGIILIGTSIPMLLTTGTLLYLGMSLDLIAIPLLIKSANLSMKEKENNKKETFLKKYRDRENRLRTYNQEKNKCHTETNYKGIDKNLSPNKVIDLNIARKKKKSSQNKKVA